MLGNQRGAGLNTPYAHTEVSLTSIAMPLEILMGAITIRLSARSRHGPRTLRINTFLIGTVFCLLDGALLYRAPTHVVTTTGAPAHTQASTQTPSVKLHPVAVAKMALRFSALPNLLDPQAGWDFAYAIAFAAARIAAIALAGATFATIGAEGADPVGDLAAIVLFLNGIDMFIHAASFAAKAIWGPGGGIAKILGTFAVIADLVITVMDAATIALLLTPASIGAAVAPLATNTAALTTIYTFTGVDLGLDIADLKDLLGA
jgi:hypothetical protein